MYIAVYLISFLTTTTQPLVLNIKNPSNHRVSKLFLLYKSFNKILYFPSGIFLLNHSLLIVLVIMILSCSLYTFLIHLSHYIALFPLLVIFGMLFYIPLNPARQQTHSKVNYKHNLVKSTQCYLYSFLLHLIKADAPATENSVAGRVTNLLVVPIGGKMNN